jgi:hypothetical protein
MLMIIFGARASYDSAESSPRLPLTKNLLSRDWRNVAAEYPASTAVIDFVEQALTADSTTLLEDALATFAALAQNSVERQKQLVAFRFYLCRVIQRATGTWLQNTNGFTHYLTLFNYLLDWQAESGEPIKVVTFNYDTLIESAVERAFTGWRFLNLADYLSRPRLTLIKPHGSFTWSRVGNDAEGARGLQNDLRAMERADLLASDLPFGMMTATTLGAHAAPEVYFPALAVPMRDKTDFECPPEQVEALESTISDVNRLLICGWRAAEQHAVQILSGISPG